MDDLVLEIGLALLLIAAAALLALRLKISMVPLLIIAGMIVGPHVPKFGPIDLQFVESAPVINFMGRVGVLFLLFYLGLEFSVTRLIKAGRSIAVGGSTYIGINFTAGLIFAYLVGLPYREILIVAGITTISSSAIVAKVLFDLRRTANRETEMILGIIMFEDVFLAVYLSLVSGIVLSEATSAAGVVFTGVFVMTFIIGLIALGRVIAPWLNKALRISSNEVFLLVVFSSLFVLAGLGETLHVAEAIGALLLGLIFAETDQSQRIEHMVVPFRDFFGAFFFFGFGLTIDPFALGGAVWLAIGAVVLTIAGNLLAGIIAGRTSGLNGQESLNVGLTIVSRGEFSIILANLAKAGNLLPGLQPFAALYVLLLAIIGPVLTSQSERIYEMWRSLSERFSAPKGNNPDLEEESA